MDGAGLGAGGAGFEVTSDRSQERSDLDGLTPERQDASIGKADGPQVVHDPGEEARLFADRLEMAVVVAVDPVKDRGRRGIDDRERRLQLVRGILEETATRDFGGLEIVGHGVE